MSAIAGIVFADGRTVPAHMPRKTIFSTPRPNLEQARVWKNGCAALIRFPPPAMAEPGRDLRPSDAASESAICFDGRLDNRSALFALLGDRRAELRDAPDGEIALALFDLLGDRFLDALLGDFASASGWRQAPPHCTGCHAGHVQERPSASGRQVPPLLMHNSTGRRRPSAIPTTGSRSNRP